MKTLLLTNKELLTLRLALFALTEQADDVIKSIKRTMSNTSELDDILLAIETNKAFYESLRDKVTDLYLT